MHSYVREFQRIVELGRRAGDAKTDDLVRAHIAQHICVLVSGIVEKTCSELLGEYAKRTANPRTGRFVKGRLGQFQNANPKKIEELLASFDPDWSLQLQVFWAGRIRDAIASVINNRHKIAHGEAVSVSLVQALTWAKDAQDFCDKLKQITAV